MVTEYPIARCVRVRGPSWIVCGFRVTSGMVPWRFALLVRLRSVADSRDRGMFGMLFPAADFIIYEHGVGDGLWCQL